MLSSLLSLIKLTNLFSALALVFLCIFPYNSKQQTAIIVFFVTYVIEFIADKRWNLYKWDKSKWVFVFFILYYLLTIFYIPFEQDAQFVGQTLEYRMAFLAFGIIGFFGHNQYYKLSYFMYTIILTCIILTINIILHIGIMNFIQTDYKIYFFALTRNMLVNTHMKFNLYVNFAIVSCYYLWKTNQNKYFRIAMIVTGLLLYSLMFLTEGRTGLLTATAIIGLLIFYSLYQWKKKLALVVIAVLIPIAIIGIANHPKMKMSGSIEKDARVTIWENALEVIKQKPIFGYGASSGKIAYIKQAETDPELNALFVDTSFAHPHSQFLLSMLEYGIIGLIVFTLINITPIICIKKSLRLYMFLFMFITIVQLSTEIYKYGVPIVFITLWISVFFNESDKKLCDKKEAIE